MSSSLPIDPLGLILSGTLYCSYFSSETSSSEVYRETREPWILSSPRSIVKFSLGPDSAPGPRDEEAPPYPDLLSAEPEGDGVEDL